VMHGMNDDTDMRRFGGLRTVMPITFVTFGLGYLAIIGVPPFAGFFSKDAIIETAMNAGGVRGWLLGGATLLGAGITAFYMTRVMLMTFFGQRRWEPNAHPHESPASMTAPMVVLALVKLGVLTAEKLRKTRSAAIVTIFTVAAFLTPSPDMVTYLLMGGPMVVLYEFCIHLARWVEPKAEIAAE